MHAVPESRRQSWRSPPHAPLQAQRSHSPPAQWSASLRTRATWLAMMDSCARLGVLRHCREAELQISAGLLAAKAGTSLEASLQARVCSEQSTVMMLPHLRDEAHLFLLQLPQQLCRAACPDLPAGHGLARRHHRPRCHHRPLLDLQPQTQDLGTPPTFDHHSSGFTCRLHDLESLLELLQTSLLGIICSSIALCLSLLTQSPSSAPAYIRHFVDT